MNQEIVKIEQEQKDISTQVNTLIIKDQESYEAGAMMKISLATFKKKIKIFFDPMVTKAKASYDQAKETRDKILNPTKDLEDTVKGKLKIYEREKEKEAQEAKEKADRERDKKIKEETKKKQDEADQAAKDEAALFGKDPSKVKAEKVEEVNPEEIDVEQPLPTIDKVSGLGIRKTYHAKIVDINKVPIEYLLPDMVALNKLSRETKATAKVPGVEFYDE